MDFETKLKLFKALSWQCWFFSILLVPLSVLSAVTYGWDSAIIPVIFLAVSLVAGFLFKLMHDERVKEYKKLNEDLDQMDDKTVEEHKEEKSDGVQYSVHPLFEELDNKEDRWG